MGRRSKPSVENLEGYNKICGWAASCSRRFSEPRNLRFAYTKRQVPLLYWFFQRELYLKITWKFRASAETMIRVLSVYRMLQAGMTSQSQAKLECTWASKCMKVPGNVFSPNATICELQTLWAPRQTLETQVTDLRALKMLQT